MALQKYTSEAPRQPEECTGALVVTDYEHQAIHLGGMFSCTIWDTAVIDTGTLSLGMNIPTGYEISLKDVRCTGFGWPFKLTAMPYTSFTPSATYKTPNNHCVKAGTPASLCTLNVNPTGIVSSDQFGFLFGGGTSVAGTGASGQGSFTREFRLQAGNHALMAENLTGATAAIMIQLTWIEFIA